MNSSDRTNILPIGNLALLNRSMINIKSDCVQQVGELLPNAYDPETIPQV